jgi:hypothetical protein
VDDGIRSNTGYVCGSTVRLSMLSCILKAHSLVTRYCGFVGRELYVRWMEGWERQNITKAFIAMIVREVVTLITHRPSDTS